MMNKSSSIVVGIFLALSLGPNAPASNSPYEDVGAAAWKAIGPNGGNIIKLVANPKNQNEIFAATGDPQGQIFRSVNGGATWVGRSVLPEYIFDLALNPFNPNSLYVLAYQSLYVSQDKGSTWSTCFLGVGNSAGSIGGRLLVGLAGPNSIIVAGSSSPDASSPSKMAILKTTDGGVRWTATPLQADSDEGSLNAIAAAPSNPRILFAGGKAYKAGRSHHYVYRSRDGGATWINVFKPWNSSITGFSVHPTNPNRVVLTTTGGAFLSKNGGAAWEETNTYPLAAIARDRKNPETLYAGSGVACHKSTDGGRTWATSAIHPYGTGQSILAGGKVVLYGSDAGVFKSTDGGKVFKTSQNGLKASDITALTVSASSPSTIYAESSGAGTFKSTNGGAIWKKFPILIPCDALREIIVDPSDAKRILILMQGSGAGYIFRSKDGGISWQQLLYAEGLAGLTTASNSRNVLLAAGMVKDQGSAYIGAYISKNGGSTWTKHRACATPGGSAETIAVDPRNADIVYVGGQRDYQAAIYKSTNGGTIWEDVTGTLQGPIHDIEIDPHIANRVYGLTWDGIYRTDDGGGSWSQVSFDRRYRVIAFHPTVANKLYAGGEFGFSMSTDGGSTWGAMNPSLPVMFVRRLAFNRHTEVLYAGTAGGGVFEIQQ
jgi:photosystem II stability/assembly factor-like uncharacterized protein